MAVLIDKQTRLLVQGLTGREGTFHARQAAAAVQVDYEVLEPVTDPFEALKPGAIDVWWYLAVGADRRNCGGWKNDATFA